MLNQEELNPTVDDLVSRSLDPAQNLVSRSLDPAQNLVEPVSVQANNQNLVDPVFVQANGQNLVGPVSVQVNSPGLVDPASVQASNSNLSPDIVQANDSYFDHNSVSNSVTSRPRRIVKPRGRPMDDQFIFK